MAFNKKADGSRKRPYTLRARARRKEEVRRRITEVTVHLHGSVGPARTTVSEIAALAGVQRATVYNHFPTDLDLIDACSSHWFAANPPPNPTPWATIQDPGLRVVTALTAMYDYYDRGQDMLENVLRDATLVPALQEILQQKWWPMMEGIVATLAEGTKIPDAGLRASLRVALDFFTWRTLAASGLPNQRAARLAARWVEASLRSDRS
jgi:AcrR family transcriptional regulator